MHTGVNGDPICQLFAERSVALDEPFHGRKAGGNAFEVVAFIEVSENTTNVYGAMTKLNILPIDNEELIRFLR